MNWFQKIKSMNYEQLSAFLADFDVSNVDEQHCKICSEKDTNGRCKHMHDCPYDDKTVIEKWLHMPCEN